MPGVSVVIPTYNRASLVGEAIQSVLDQSYRDFEVIVVDDGSNDETRAVVTALKGPITYIYQDNRGRCVARNRGILQSSGRYVVFLDSDDMLLPDALRVQSVYLDTHPGVGIVYSDGYYCDEAGRSLDRVSVSRPPLRGSNMLETLVLDNVVIPPHSAMVRKSCLDRLGYPFFDEGLSVGEDTEFWIRLAALGCVFEYQDVATCKYRIHAGNTFATGRFLHDMQCLRESLHKTYNGDYFLELSPEIQKTFFNFYLLGYLAVDPTSQERILASRNFGQLSAEIQAMVLYFIGVKNITEDGMVRVGRERLRKALAADAKWKYRIALHLSSLGPAPLRLTVQARRRIRRLGTRQPPQSPVQARFLEYANRATIKS
jgi:glycosyltransferase involved in cell wall biosynthesis